MLEYLQEFNLSTFYWFLAGVCGFGFGLSKAGLFGTQQLMVPIMAVIFGGKPSTGLVLPMLITADIFAVTYYKRYAQWNYILKLMPWAIVGILLGTFFGNAINDAQFKKAIGLMVIVFLSLIIWQDFRKDNVTVPDHWWFSALMGLVGGFSSMVGNTAGPVMTMYLLSMRLHKNNYIGTWAWFFFLMNLIKVPFHIFFWKTIHLQSLSFNLVMIPPIILGALVGIRIVKFIPDKGYRIFIILATLVAALLLFKPPLK